MPRTADQLVKDEVLTNISTLVYELATEVPDSLDCGWSAYELCTPVLDWESAARDAGWTCVEREGFPSGTQFEDTTDGMKWPCSGWQELCEAHDIEPHEREILEHWVVTEWLGHKLEEKGERVDFDFADLCIWGRTTSGQAIAIDGVIAEIVKDCADALEEATS